MSRTVQPLTQQGFAPFGDVIEHHGAERRHPLSVDYAREHNDIRQAFWVSKVIEEIGFPAQLKFMERHPFSDQAFVPLRDSRFLVVICPDNADGTPDVSQVQAFVAEPGQGVIYKRNVWHAPLTSLNAPAEFFVTMGVTDKAANDEFFELATPLIIEAGSL